MKKVKVKIRLQDDGRYTSETVHSVSERTAKKRILCAENPSEEAASIRTVADAAKLMNLIRTNFATVNGSTYTLYTVQA